MEEERVDRGRSQRARERAMEVGGWRRKGMIGETEGTTQVERDERKREKGKEGWTVGEGEGKL